MTQEIALEKAKEEANGASVTVSHGAFNGSYTSTVTNQTLSKVVNSAEFLDRTSFNDPVGPPWKKGYWLRYDRGTDWAQEDWTCRHATGWANNAEPKKGCWPG